MFSLIIYFLEHALEPDNKLLFMLLNDNETVSRIRKLGLIKLNRPRLFNN